MESTLSAFLASESRVMGGSTSGSRDDFITMKTPLGIWVNLHSDRFKNPVSFAASTRSYTRAQSDAIPLLGLLLLLLFLLLFLLFFFVVVVVLKRMRVKAENKEHRSQ